MAKHNFSSSVNESLNGRDRSQSQEKLLPLASPPSQDISAASDCIKPKKRAGRKKLNESEKRKQMVLTLSASTYKKLIEWAESKPKSAPNYISNFIDEHIDEIINKI